MASHYLPPLHHRRAQVLRTDYNESLAATVALSLAYPTSHNLGPDACDLLGVVALFPQGIDEKHISWLSPTISNRNDEQLDTAHRQVARCFCEPSEVFVSAFLCSLNTERGVTLYITFTLPTKKQWFTNSSGQTLDALDMVFVICDKEYVFDGEPVGSTHPDVSSPMISMIGCPIKP